MNKDLRQLLAILLLPLILLLYFNRMANWHYHQLSNGIVIEHAHPYPKTSDSRSYPFADHHHTDSEYYYLDVLFRTVFVLVLTAFALLLLRNLLVRQPECHDLVALPSLIPGESSPRAPPSK